jgi:hypothetical protein
MGSGIMTNKKGRGGRVLKCAKNPLLANTPITMTQAVTASRVVANTRFWAWTFHLVLVKALRRNIKTTNRQLSAKSPIKVPGVFVVFILQVFRM